MKSQTATFYLLDTYLSPEDPIFDQLLDYFEWNRNVRGLSVTHTLHMKAHTIRDFVRFTKLTDIRDVTNAMIDGYMADKRAKGLKGTTINGYFKIIATLVRWMKNSDMEIPGLKLSRLYCCVEETPERYFASERQVNQALEYADRQEWLLIKLAFDCGLRISELRSLRLTDIDGYLDGRYIRIKGKGNGRRGVVMSEATRRRLNHWIVREHITDWLWPNKQGTGPISDVQCRQLMKAPFAAAGMPYMRPHDIRRSYAVDLETKGASRRQIKAGLGHASIQTTELYLQNACDSDVISLSKIKFRERELAYDY